MCSRACMSVYECVHKINYIYACEYAKYHYVLTIKSDR